MLVITAPLADVGGTVVGETAVSCITTTPARDFRKSVMTCDGVITLRDGTLTFQAAIRPAHEPIVGAVTGGTGAYANASGVLEVADGVDTITLAP